MIPARQLLQEGRVYGGGLHKLEPKEPANVPMPELAGLLSEDDMASDQSDLFATS